ncbi:MAG: hypothetical protein A2Z25_00715 [Planctomycetes bacterium RBG_16_55_9]|nr:MAG: hypothetical protein A2Z25_00715 [Planctomycetes bacterium RBG_16_55_9]
MTKKETKAKNSKIEREEKDFMPGTETEDQFDKVLFLLSEWIKAGIVSVDIDVDGVITFNLPREMDKLLETQLPADLTHKNVAGIIRSEIPALISAGLERNPERKLRMTMPEELHGRITTMTKRCERTVSTLVDTGIKERILLRKTTPSYVVDDVQAIQSTYHVESSKGEKIDLPFVSLELTIAKPRSGYTLEGRPQEGTLRFGRKDVMRVVLDLHKDDMKDLIQKLEKARDQTCAKGE